MTRQRKTAKLLNSPLPTLSSIHTIAFDFDGVFTDNTVWVDEKGLESVRCYRGDGLAMDLVRAAQRRGHLRVDCFIVSTETNAVVQARANKLKIECHHGVADKLDFMTKYLTDRLPAHTDPFLGLIYLGNDLNDLAVMRRAGYAVAPADAHPLVRDVAQLVMPQRGGEGFVRAFVEGLLGVNQLPREEIDELVSGR